MSKLRDELTELALEIVQRARQAETPFDLKVDAFKAVSSYDLGLLRKKKPGEDDEKPDRVTFGKLQQRIRAVESN